MFEPRYLTDGVHLYEIESVVRNYGKTSGLIMTVRDCVTEILRELDAVEQAVMSPVKSDG